MNIKKKINRRLKIKRRVASRIKGTAQRPRLVVFRSNNEIYAQLINDDNAVTLIAASSIEKSLSDAKGNKIEIAAVVGKRIAEKAKAAGIESVVFDRNGYLYHGRVKSLADGAREGGLKF
jgi:large subunit ribosomal protein L18